MVWCIPRVSNFGEILLQYRSAGLQFSSTARVYLVEQKLNIMTGNCRDFPGVSVSHNCKKLIARLGLQRFQIETIQFLPASSLVIMET